MICFVRFTWKYHVDPFFEFVISIKDVFQLKGGNNCIL